MANYEYLDKAGTLYVVTKIKGILSGYVEKDGNKVLTDNNFTDELKAKLDGIAEGATKTIIDSVMSDDSENPVQNKVIKAALDVLAPLANPNFTGIPTAPTAISGTNSTQIATTAFVKTAVDDALGNVAGLSFDGPYTDYAALVSTVTEPKAGVIYLVSNSGSVPNANDEYFWNTKTNSFELFGTTTVDLSGYLKKTELVAITNEEIDAMFS